MIAVIDYDTGNLCSVANALGRLGAEYRITASPDEIRGADRVLLPGVGEASSAMQKLRERSLVEVIRSLTQPVLGICIGVQLLYHRQPVVLNHEMTLGSASAGRFTLPLTARYYQTRSRITAGQVSAVATYTLHYD